MDGCIGVFEVVKFHTKRHRAHRAHQSPIHKSGEIVESKILSGSKIKDAIKNQVNPHRIAVAYLGRQWENWINIHELEEIIVAPILGTNPYALNDLIEKIEGGLKNVHLLESLHAKIYIGKEFALIGSCNLSNNALSGEHLEEIAYLISDQHEIQKLNHEFDRLKKRAQQTESKKEDALNKLMSMHKWAEAKGIIKDEKSSPKKAILQERVDAFKIAWYFKDCGELKAKSESLENEGLNESDIKDHLSFANEDTLQSGDWILAYEVTTGKDGRIKKIWRVSWLYIDGSIKNGAEDCDAYHQYCYQLTNDARKKKVPSGQQKYSRLPPFPFLLNEETIKAIKELIREIDEQREDHPLESILPPLDENSIWRLHDESACFDFYDRLRKKLGSSSFRVEFDSENPS